MCAALNHNNATNRERLDFEQTCFRYEQKNEQQRLYSSSVHRVCARNILAQHMCVYNDENASYIYSNIKRHHRGNVIIRSGIEHVTI